MAEAKQQTLSCKHKGEIIVSRPFDFEALCLINDMIMRGDKGKFSAAYNALPYMFEGTKITNEVISCMEMTELGLMCDELWGFYLEEIQRMSDMKLKNK